MASVFPNRFQPQDKGDLDTRLTKAFAFIGAVLARHGQRFLLSSVRP